MRRSLALLSLVAGLSASAAAEPPPRDAKAWDAVVRDARLGQAFYIDPAAFRSWVEGREPADALTSVVAALREEDGTYTGNDVLVDDLPHATALVLASTALGSGEDATLEPTVALLFEGGPDRVVALLDLERRRLCVIQAGGGAPVVRTLPLTTRELERRASGLMLSGPDHREVLAAPGRVSAEVRALLEAPDAVTLYALGEQGWDGAWLKAGAGAPDGFAAALAALREPAVVRGQVTLLRPRTRSRIGRGVLEALTKPSALSIMCWDPHHVVHVQRGDAEAVLVLCGDCDKARVLVRGGADAAALQPFRGGFVLADMDAILALHGVPRLPPRGKRGERAPAAPPAPAEQPAEAPATPR